MGYKITDFPPNVQEQIRNELRKSSVANRVTPAVTDMEQDSGNESVGAKAGAGHDSPCSCLIHSFRHRLADPDGVSGKACLDGLVHAGILQDDSTKFIQEVRHKQTKIPKAQKEYTVIELIEAGDSPTQTEKESEV